MKTIFKVYALAAATLLFAACENKPASTAEDSLPVRDIEKDGMAGSELEMQAEAADINIRPTTDNPAFPGATLMLTAPKEDKLKPGTVDFAFDVKNYELSKPTDMAGHEHMANSHKGQHIHFIMDNQPYEALYEPKHRTELAEGTHVLLAFLSRSYHLSVKEPKAFIVKKLTVGNPDNSEEVDLSAAHMFYSRPKGTYKGEDAKSVLLDFYLVNTKLSAGGNIVRATIDGKEFKIDKWQPYIIEGLQAGEHTVKLELLDADGIPISGPFNTVERTFTVEM